MTGPSINIPLDLSSLTNAKEKVKILRKELREANKDIEKAKKGGHAVTAEQKKRYQQAQRNFDQFQAKIQSSQQRVRDFVDSRVAMQKQGNFVGNSLDSYSRIVAAKALARNIADTANNYSAPRITDEVVGRNSFDQDIDYKYSPSRGYRTGEVFKSAGEMALASSNPYVKAGGAIAYGLGKLGTTSEDYAEGQRYKQQQDQLHKRSISSELQQKIHDQYLKEHEFFGIDAITERLGLGNLGLSKFKDWNDKHSLLGKGAYTKGDLQAERADQNAKHAALESLRQQRNAAVDLGNFSGARQIMARAPSITPGLNIANQIWRNPAELYTQRESAREASKSWARNNCSRAGPRTGD